MDITFVGLDLRGQLHICVPEGHKAKTVAVAILGINTITRCDVPAKDSSVVIARFDEQLNPTVIAAQCAIALMEDEDTLRAILKLRIHVSAIPGTDEMYCQLIADAIELTALEQERRPPVMLSDHCQATSDDGITQRYTRIAA